MEHLTSPAPEEPDRDRREARRLAIVAALYDAGEPLTPAQLRQRTGISPIMLASTIKMSHRTFRWDVNHKNVITLVELAPDLQVQQWRG